MTPLSSAVPDASSVLTKAGITTWTSTPGAVELAAQGLREAHDAVLTGGVGRAARSAELARDRGDVHDVAGAARLHAADRLLGAVEDGVEVELELADRGRVRLLLERADRHDAGVVDDDVDRAEAGLDVVERGREGGPVRDVEGEPDRPAADLGGGLLGDGAVEVRDRDAHALAGERVGERLADAAATAGDHGHLAGEGAQLLSHWYSVPPQETRRTVRRKNRSG